MKNVRFAAILLCLLPACAPGLPGGALAPLPEDPAVVRGVLPNGLRYYVRANREPAARAELRLVVNVGSILEDPDQRGLAHFVEHMAFNGTASFERQALVGYLERAGMRFGPDINAYTSFDETVYMLTVPTDSARVFETGMQILEEWAHGVTFDSLEVEKERGVVLEEWRLGQGASSRMQEKQFPLIVGGGRYAERLPIGTPESLRTFDHDALRRFYREWYRPDLMAVVAVGDFDAEAVERMIVARFGAIPNPPEPRPRERFGVHDHAETLVSVATDPEATSASISLYLKRAPTTWESVAAYRLWLAEALASGMLTNRISERSQEANAPFLDFSSYEGRFLHPVAVYMLSVRVPDAGIERGLEELVVELERADRHGFTPTEIEREKRTALRRIEQRYLERARATSGGFAAEYAASFAYGGVVLSIEDEYRLQGELLEKITAAEVNSVAGRWIGESNRVVIVNAPRVDSLPVPTEEALQAVVRSVRDRRIEPYADATSDAPLLRDPPEPGAIASERHHPEVGVTEWRLANGARVILKPTDFRNDEVMLAGRSPGGTSLASDEDYLAAYLASAVVQAGGLGELSLMDLTKRLSGTLVGVGADIGELSEVVSGGGSPRDLETLFQLVYLKFTAPRLDSVAIEAYRQQARASLANRAASPEQIFSDSLRAILSGNHPRARPLTSADFDRLDVARSFDFYRERFADASDFTFYLVGNFSLDEVRPHVLKYLASLPSLRRVERGRDVGMRAPRGVVRTVVRKGVEPKSLTQVVFTGETEVTRETVYLLNALREVLQLRLRDVLREDMGGTYGVQVGAGAAREPHPRYQVTLGFGSDPARADELLGATFAEIARLKREGPTVPEMEKVREIEIRARETEMRSNQFWITQLMSYTGQGWDLRGILEYPTWIQSLGAERVREAANRFLDETNFVQATLVPEGAN